MVEDEFRFGNIPAVMFVNVKGMKKVGSQEKKHISVTKR